MSEQRGPLTGKHQLISRKFLTCGSLSESELLKYCRENRLQIDEQKIHEELIIPINIAVKTWGMEIKKIKSDADGKFYYCLVETRQDKAVSKNFVNLTDEKQILILKAIMEEMESHSGMITEKKCLELHKKIPRCKKEDAEFVLAHLLQQQWLVNHPYRPIYESNGTHMLCLGVKCQAELTQKYFRNISQKCDICHQPCVLAATCGRFCSSNQMEDEKEEDEEEKKDAVHCPGRAHFSCVESFARRRAAASSAKQCYECLQCKKDWDRFDPDQVQPPIQ